MPSKINISILLFLVSLLFSSCGGNVSAVVDDVTPQYRELVSLLSENNSSKEIPHDKLRAIGIVRINDKFLYSPELMKAQYKNRRQPTTKELQSIIDLVNYLNRDVVPPVIKLNGNKNISIDTTTPYIEFGASATDNVDGNLTSKIIIKGKVDNSKIGKYIINYSVSDKSNNKIDINRTVTVLDKIKPIITINGSQSLSIEAGNSYIELGASATDNIDGNISSKVIIKNNVDITKKGDYTITYDVNDSSNNQAIQKIRNVKITPDITPPILSLIGQNLVIDQGTIYIELGATAFDKLDKNITNRVVIRGTIDNTREGNYTITYDVNDSANNQAIQLTRKIQVTKDRTPPIITLNSNANITIEFKSPYVELGAKAYDLLDGNITNISINSNVNSNAIGDYQVKYNVSDSSGNQAIEVVRNVFVRDRVKPTFTTPNSISVDENQKFVMDINATDLRTISYSTTNTLFDINISTGILKFKNNPDYETATSHSVIIVASDGTNFENQTLTININNLNDNLPVFTNVNSVNVNENQTSAITLTATDADRDNLTYDLNDTATFNINSSSGVVTFKNAPNYEAKTIYSLNTSVSDGVHEINQTITINIDNLNDIAPIFTSSSSVSVDENQLSVITLSATDVEGDTLTYKIDKVSIFNINTSSGLITFKNTPDFEDQSSYTLKTSVSDGVHETNQTLTITINDLNEAPIFTSASSVNVNENQSNVINLTATDPEGNSLTYKIDDTTNFNISNGGIIFINNPDFETKNSYIIKTSVSDGTYETNQTLTININNVNDVAPVFTNGNSISVNENQLNAIILTATDVEGDTLTYELNDTATFNINTSSGAITFKTAPNYEAKTSYSLNTSVKDGVHEINQTVTITILDIADVRPSLTGFNVTKSENIPIGTPLGKVTVTDIGDTPITSFTISDTINFEINSSGAIKTRALLDFESIPTHNLTVTAINSAGASTPVNVVLTLINVAEIKPTLTAFSTTIAEDTATTTNIGKVTVSNGGDSAITAFTLTNTTNFEINASGNIKTKTTFDYESSTSYSTTVTATNTAGTSSSVTVTVNISNVPEVAPVLSAFSVSIAENTAINTNIGTISATVGDTPITSFTLSNNPNFTIDNNGRISVSTALDFESTPSYSLTVTATNGKGVSNTANVNITITNVPDVIPILTGFTTTIAEDTATNIVVGTVTVSNTLDTPITSFTLSNNPNFTINNSGAISIRTALDFETNSIYNLTVTATSLAGTSSSVNVTINISNVAEVAPTLSAFTTTIAENTATNTNIGTVTVSNGGDTPITAFTLSDTTNFTINSSGVIQTKTAFDYENTTSYSLTVTATNGKGVSNSVNVNIAISNIAESVPTLSAFSTTIAEDTAINTNIGTVTVSDGGDTPVTAFTLSNSTNFTINNSGVIQTKTLLDFETTPSYSLTVTATNGKGVSNSVNVTINISNVPEVAPTLTAFSTSIAENTIINTNIGTISVSDRGDTPITVFTLSNSTNFTINSSGVIQTKTLLDFETTPSYSLTVTATNGKGVSNTVNVTINILNVAETTPTLSNFTRNVDENTAINTNIGTVTVSDAGDSAITVFTLSNSTNFTINSSGVIQTKTALDYETTTSYSLTVTATNSAGPSSSATVTININNLNDNSPVFTNTNSLSVNENQLNAITLTATDADGGSLTYKINDTATFNINGSSGLVTFKTAPDYEDKTSYTLKTSVTDGLHEVNQTVTININNIIENVPILIGTENNISINETTTISTEIGTILITSQTDANISSFEINGTDKNIISISSDTGVITLDKKLDFELRESYEFNITAINDAGRSNTIVLNIKVLDVDDLYLLSAVYNDKNTATTTDDILNIYFSKAIDKTTISSTTSSNYTIIGTGAIGNSVGSDYNDTYLRHKISLNASSTAFIVNEDNISLANSIKDVGLTLPFNTTPIFIVKKGSIKQTGQEKTYHINDNGTYKKGSKATYSRDNTHKIVLDHITELMWEDDTNVTTTTNTNTSAITYCTNLTLGNFSDWRLPTIRELETIVFEAKSNPSIDNSFKNISSRIYWSNTIFKPYNQFYWGIDFNSGDINPYDKTTTYYVRCVRDN